MVNTSALNTAVSTEEIRLGMFVAELDRPWLETPFLMQGFIVSDATEIALLQRYCPPVPNQSALESLIKLRGIKFRETLVDQFIQCVGLYPVGTLLELNTGEVAVVIQQNQVRRLKPKLMILLAEDKSVERHPRNLDLMLDPLTPTGEPYRIGHALPTDAYGIDWREFFLD